MLSGEFPDRILWQPAIRSVQAYIGEHQNNSGLMQYVIKDVHQRIEMIVVVICVEGCTYRSQNMCLFS